jgi:hypothetical protein
LISIALRNVQIWAKLLEQKIGADVLIGIVGIGFERWRLRDAIALPLG